MLKLLDWWCRRYHKHAHRMVWEHMGRQLMECRLCLRTWGRYDMEDD